MEDSKMKLQIRRAQEGDLSRLISLYRAVASVSSGLARRESEITEQFGRNLLAETQLHGLLMVVEDASRELIGAIHARHGEAESLRHVMGHLTILVHPDSQSKGIGRRLFQEFLQVVQKQFHFVLRVELRARASNIEALRFYRSLGFIEEGRFRFRIRAVNGDFEDGIPMVWFNPCWEKRLLLDAPLEVALGLAVYLKP